MDIRAIFSVQNNLLDDLLGGRIVNPEKRKSFCASIDFE